VTQLAEAQKRTEQRLNELAEAQQRTEERVNELAEAQKRTEERLERLEVTVAQLVEAQQRTEQRLNELAEAQQRTEQRVNELTEAQRDMARTLDELIRVVKSHADRLAVLDGRTLEMQFRDRAPAYLGTVLRRTRVISAGDLGDELEGVLSAEEWADLLRADAILQGRALLEGERREVYVVAEVSATLDEGDVARAARRAALLRKKGWKVLAVAAGTQTTPELIASARQLGVAVLRDGEQFNWPEALTAA
jgi:vacuolar-type H+-ATPase subunit I/STV1